MADQSPKKIIREKIAILLKSLSEEVVTSCSERICNRLISNDLFQKSSCVALYYAIDNEVQTLALMDAWRFEKQIVLPAVSGDDMHFYPYTGKENLKKGVFGIAEPVSDDLIPPDNIDLFVVPGIAFDHACNRLGRGKGYYDRYLAAVNKPVVGLCFDCQLVEILPSEIHDKKMTIVITESIEYHRITTSSMTSAPACLFSAATKRLRMDTISSRATEEDMDT